MQLLKIFEPLLVLLFLAFVATLGLVCAAFYMGTPIDPVLAITSAFITFTIYAVNRYTDKEDNFNSREHLTFFQRNDFILWLSILLLVLSFVWLAVSNKLTWFQFLITFIGIAYSVKMIPCFHDGHFQWIRFKDICIAKSAIVALVWGTSYFLITWCVYPCFVKDPLNVIMLMGNFTIATFTATVFTDIRDVDGDRAAGVQTIPARFGVENTYKYAIILPSMIFGVISFLFTCFHLLSIPMLIFFIINLCYPIVYVGIYYSGKCPMRLIEPLVDTCFIIFSVGLIILKNIG